MLDMFDVKVCVSIVDTLAKVKIVVITRSKISWLIIGICSSTVRAVQQPQQQRNSPTFLYMNIVQIVMSPKGNFVQLSITTVFAHVVTEINKRQQKA